MSLADARRHMQAAEELLAEACERGVSTERVVQWSAMASGHAQLAQAYLLEAAAQPPRVMAPQAEFTPGLLYPGSPPGEPVVVRATPPAPAPDETDAEMLAAAEQSFRARLGTLCDEAGVPVPERDTAMASVAGTISGSRVEFEYDATPAVRAAMGGA